MGEAAISTGSIHTFQSRSGARKFPRVEFPAQIEIDGSCTQPKSGVLAGSRSTMPNYPEKKVTSTTATSVLNCPLGDFPPRCSLK